MKKLVFIFCVGFLLLPALALGQDFELSTDEVYAEETSSAVGICILPKSCKGKTYSKCYKTCREVNKSMDGKLNPHCEKPCRRQCTTLCDAIVHDLEEELEEVYEELEQLLTEEILE